MDLLSGFEFSSLFVITDQLLLVHPFSASSYVNSSRGDVEEGQEMNKTTVDVFAVDSGEDGDGRIASNRSVG